MKKFLPVLIVLLIVASCVMVGVAVASEGPGGNGKHGPRGGEFGNVEDFRGKAAQLEGLRVLPEQSPQELGIFQLTD